MKIKFFLLALGLNNILFISSAQFPEDTLRNNALRVYMDATDYIKEEIQFVNYVRDARDAQVHIIFTTEPTASGGKKITYYFYGESEMKGMSDTISFSLGKNTTQDEARMAQVMILKAGLMRFVAKTPLLEHMDIRYTLPLQQEISDDPWNNWLFEVTVNGSAQGQKTSNSVDLNMELATSRITSRSKFILDLDYGYGKDYFEIKDKTIETYDKSSSLFAMGAKSLGNHWSAGAILEMSSSSFSNLDFLFQIYPSLEYDLFPYSQANRKQLIFNYSFGYSYNNYTDTTIYNMLEEHLFGHSFKISGSAIQKWGHVNLGLAYSNYFHDWSKNKLTFKSSVSLRITKGLGVNFEGVLTLLHDQLSLAKAGATDAEILLQRKEISTQFSYRTMVGITYTFGSIYSNVVNPRLNVHMK